MSIPSEQAALIVKLRSRAWEDRQHRKLREQAASALEELDARIVELERELAEARKALLHLNKEIRGSMGMAPEAIRREIGNTNFACLETRSKEADAVLAASALPVKP